MTLSNVSLQANPTGISSQPDPTLSLHFTIDKMPGFLSPETRLVLTEASKQAFEAGKPKQGYIGLAELPDPNNPNEDQSIVKIHLIPAFNKNDGLLRTDKFNQPFAGAVESMQELGNFTGDLHTFSAAKLELGNKAGINGLLFGFGIWKSGIGVKFLEELPQKEARIRNEYLFILNSEKKQWEIYFIDDELDYYQPKKLPKILCLKISKLPTNFKQLNPKQRLDLEDTIKTWVKETHNNHGEIEGNIGFVKNRSSSQNQFSCHYTENYRNYFNDPKTLDGDLKGSAHSFRLPRELPLLIFQKLLNGITHQLNINPVNNLTSSAVTSGSKAGGPRTHLVAENKYISNSLKTAMKIRNIDIIEKIIANYPEKNNLDYLETAMKYGYADVVMLFVKHRSNKYSISPITLAIEEGQLEIARILIEQGTDLDQIKQDRYGPIVSRKSPLTAAIAKGHIELIKLLTAFKAKLNARDGKENIPLVYAIEEEQFGIAKMLIEAGANLDQANQNTYYLEVSKKSPLTAAIAKGRIELIKLLIAFKAKLNARDGNSNTPLVYAIEEGQFGIAKMLIEAGADPNTANKSKFIHSFKFYDKSPLIAAVEAENKELVELLLDRGANINQSSNAKAPLTTAIRTGNTEIADLLLARGADLSRIDENQKLYCGETCLMHAIKNTNVAMVEWLINHNVIDLSAIDDRDNNALHILAECHDYQQDNYIKNKLSDIALLLLQNSRVNVKKEILQTKNQSNINNISIHAHITPLHTAVKNRSQGLASILLSRPEIDVNQRTGFDYMALHIATLNGDHNMVNFLLAKGAEVDSQNQYKYGHEITRGKTPLMVAIVSNDHKMVELLLENGASTSMQDNTGRNALFYAIASDFCLKDQISKFKRIRNGNKEQNYDDKQVKNSNKLDIVTLLLKQPNISINLQDNDGNTPLMDLIKAMSYEMTANNIVICKLLLEHGADVTITNKDGKTALSMLKSHNVSAKCTQQKEQLLQLLERTEKQTLEKTEYQQSVIGQLSNSLSNLFSNSTTLSSNKSGPLSFISLSPH